jgi:hypothetical protein
MWPRRGSVSGAWICLAVGGFANCTSAQNDRSVLLAGTCWEVTQPVESTNPELLLPPLVQLDSAPFQPGTERRRVVELPGSMPSVHHIAFWRTLPPDSVEIAWSTGFSGWVFRLGIAGDTLRGQAEEIYDAGEGRVAPARMVRFPCDVSFLRSTGRR